MKPYRSVDTPAQLSVIKLLQYIEIDYEIVTNQAGNPGHDILLKYGGMVYNGTLQLYNPYVWMNVNLRIQFSTYLQLTCWQGETNYDIAPEFLLTHPNPQPFTNMTIDIQANTTPSLYVSLSEIRVFNLDPSQSWGEYFKYYYGIWPSPSTFSSQNQYFTAYSSVLYLDINNATKQYANPNAVAFPVNRCLYSTYVTPQILDNGQVLPSNYVASANQCTACPTTDCLVCPINYGGSCKICSSSKTSKCVVDTILCPVGYFNQNGICQRCPPGCTSCQSNTNCTGCQASLVLSQTLTTSVCKCLDGMYGIPSFTTYQITCQNCDQTKCQFCQGSATSCTTCFVSKSLYLYGSTCVADCTTQLIPSYTDPVINKCDPCGQYCQKCQNASYCNPSQCLWQQGTPGGTLAFNHNGACMTVCPSNSIMNIPGQTCDDCLNNCAVCYGNVNNCTVCNIGYYLNGAVCVTQCPSGYYPDTSNVCQLCPSQCVTCLAASQCTMCVNIQGTPSQQFFFVNYQCVLTCPDQYYPDSANATNYFCRSCPSGCNQCSNEYTCTVCNTGWYLDSFYGGTRFLCVSQCKPGTYPNNGTMSCLPCLTACQTCDNATSCTQCQQGLVLQTSIVGPPTCGIACPNGMYPNDYNKCQNCIAGCQLCSNNYTCNQCSVGYYQLVDTLSCVHLTCPPGYYISGQQCALCQPQCQTCSSGLTCDSCIVDYSFKSNQCILKCGNGAREDNEQCDDGNNIDGDGCSAVCVQETGYDCMPLDPTTAGPDVCFCDPKLISASWTSYWGAISIKFGTNIIYNPAVSGTKSANSLTFCSQILDPTMLPNLGTSYSCFLTSSGSQTSITINVDLDSQLGNNAMNYQTSILLINGALSAQGCSVGIPLRYTLTNLPLDSPIVYIQSTHNGLIVPMCSPYYGLNIFTSKGFTIRNVKVTWTLISMNPDNSDLRSSLQSYLDTTYTNIQFFEFNEAQVESLAGTSVTLKVQVTNFLGLVGTNTTTITFSNSKQLMIIDLQDIYTFQVDVANTLAPRVRIPYCAADNSSRQSVDLLSIQLKCTLYSSDMALSTPLTNCTILPYNMTLGKSYQVKVQADNFKDPSQSVIKWVHIDTASPNAEIAYIKGCDRLFSVDDSFDLEAMITTNATFANFNWYCTDASTGSPCFTTSYSYITMANTKGVTLGGGQFFPNNTYLFTVTVLDSLSQTQVTKQCNMYAALSGTTILGISIDTEANKNGYIDFNAQMAAFKVQLLDLSGINTQALSFKWKFTDSSGTVFPSSQLSIYQNSLGVLISKLQRSNVYQVQVNATYGQSVGYINTKFQTEPSMSLEFSVQPTSGEPHLTIFTFSVTSQDTYDGLYSYVFGYVNPDDGISNIPIYQKTPNRYQRTLLPFPTNQNYLTCYVQIMLPSGESKTYLQNVTLTFPSITVSDFQGQLSSAVMDDLIESTQIKNKLVTLSGRMQLSDISFAIKQVLAGLQGERTRISDYNIQSSVASLLEYISGQTKPLLSDPQIVTVSASLFNQMTIGENTQISNGQYSQFGRAATFSLYNFANNIFKIDFTNITGGGA